MEGKRKHKSHSLVALNAKYLHGVVPATKSVKTRAWHCNPDDIVHESRDAMLWNIIALSKVTTNRISSKTK